MQKTDGNFSSQRASMLGEGLVDEGRHNCRVVSQLVQSQLLSNTDRSGKVYSQV